MSLTCLSCRNVMESGSSPPLGSCPQCGSNWLGQAAAWLHWNGPAGENKVRLVKECLTIGRRSENDVAIRDPQISKMHALVIRDGTHWLVRDGNSANGTFVNGRRIVEKEIRDGDVIQVGETQIRFYVQLEEDDSSRISIVPQPSVSNPVVTCLPCDSGEFRPEWEIKDEEQLRRDYECLRTAHLFNSYMDRERDERALLQNILEFAFELLPADRGAILLREEEGAPLTQVVTHHREIRRQDCGEISIPDSMIRRAVEERNAVLSTNAAEDSRFRCSESIARENVRSAMCVPLIGPQEVMGILHLDTQEQTSAFTTKDLMLLSTLAAQASTLIDRFRLQKRLEKEASTRERLAHFLAPEVLKEIEERGLNVDGQGRTGRVTVVFCDIRGFSSLAETMHPTQLVQMLNSFFERMVDVVFQHGGMLDKFIGDALMAVWGVPFSGRNDAQRAVEAGKDMLEAVTIFNQGSRAQGWPEIQVGVGVNTGEAVIGIVGSSRRMDYTVMGDAVNLAARVCDLARGGQMLLTEETRQEVMQESAPLKVQELAPVQVRGRRNLVRVCEWVGNQMGSCS